ncbi:alpha/beta hydrolase fold family protein [Mycobacterium ulcerans str. Harvey]|uniref:Alpha/beta hydrolase fold family protein n=1 Tax=Mycobacterium ulcerans str. Harvey TaxID=1299332 RepID=A0ABP3ADJ1_MYCUL|nr:alpha/beta hydrolase fold family protein [Mycobacterium ulcerans str. Harvey]
MPDGRELACLEWGDPTGYPTFYFHGTLSSRLEGAFADGAARRARFRLIAVDRPGYGRSTFQEGRTLRDWPADVCALADALGLDKFGVVGHSGAGTHLFACGARIALSRLAFIGALGPGGRWRRRKSWVASIWRTGPTPVWPNMGRGCFTPCSPRSVGVQSTHPDCSPS